MDVSKLSYSEQAKFQAWVDENQAREVGRMVSSLVDRCFNDCVMDFTSKVTNNKERTCVSRCMEKSQKAGERSSMRFAEINALFAQQQLETGNVFGIDNSDPPKQ